MRPLQLTIEGLKSVAESQTINFEKLSENGVFGIFGRTGSGKSTILDAIVLALYGDIVAGKANKDFVNVDCMQTRVYLVFSISSGENKGKYSIERVYKFNKARTDLTQSVAKLWKTDGDKEICLADNNRELNDKIQNEIIGLKKEDFLKCIALPQGEFSAFVKMARGERIKVIGKLFDLEKYGIELQDKISAVLGRLRDDKIRIDTKLEQLDEFKPEKIAEMKTAVDVALNQKETAAKEKQEFLPKVESAKTVISLRKEKIETDGKICKISGNKSIIDGFRQEIQLFDKVFKDASGVKEAVRLKKSISEYEKNMAAAESKIPLLVRRKEELEKQTATFEEKEKKIAALKVRLEKTDELSAKEKELAEKKKRLVELRELYAKAKKAYDFNSNEITLHGNKSKEYLDLANKTDDVLLLEKIGEAASSETLSQFSKERIVFLEELKKVLSDKLVKGCESAVNRLIDREIELLSSIINDKKTDGDLADTLDKAAKAIRQKAQYNSLARDESEKVVSCKKEFEKAQEDMKRVGDDGTVLRSECDNIEKAIFEVTGGKTAEECCELIKEEISDEERKIKKTRDEFNAVSEQLVALKAKNLADNEHVKELKDALEKAKAGYAGVLSELKIDEQTALNILDGQKTIEEKRLKVSEFDENMTFLTKKVAETEKKLEELKEFSAADEILSEYAIIEDKLEKNNIYYNKLRADYENGLKKSDEWCIMTKESDKTESALTLYGRLADLVRAGRFMEFIADEYLHEVAADAEKRVLELTSGKYGLVYDGEFAVTDNLHGGIRRPASGLSGGETFLVSLSLALALASEISRKALKPVDFFFLDEGFGTLDDELIDTVTDSLEKLRRENLTVGLITHVGELKNRISSSLNVIGANAEHGTRFIED